MTVAGEGLPPWFSESADSKGVTGRRLERVGGSGVSGEGRKGARTVLGFGADRESSEVHAGV